MMNNLLGLDERSSVATIVGTFFFLVIMIGGFTALVTAFELNSDLLESQFKISEQETQKVQENFTIQAAYDSVLAPSSGANTLCVTIDNIGAVPLEIPDLFIVNKTDSDAPVFPIEISHKDAFVPMGSIKNILESRTGPANSIVVTDTTHTLDIKAVTTSGITKTTELAVFSTASGDDPRLDVTAFVMPKNVASGQEAVVGMFVRNAANTTLLDVKPASTRNSGNPTVTPSTAVTSFSLTTASSIDRLDPDETVVFMWDPEITGGVGSTITFTLEAEGKVLGCSDGSSTIESATDAESLQIVPGVRREIFARPELLITFPNPFGSSTGLGYWAVAAANPTDEAVDVQQVSIQLINSENADLIKTATGITAIQPTNSWNVDKNMMFWSNFASPETINAFEAIEFIAQTQPSNAPSDYPVNTIVFSIYSSFGQFNVVPFTFGFDTSNTAVVNVFMNTTATSAGAITLLKSGIQTGTTVTFDITIANSGSGAAEINDDASLLINIPPGWTSITNGAADPVGGMSVGTHLEFADGSTQIPVNLDSAMGIETRSFQFTAVAPSVSTTALYILTLTAQGTATGGVIVGPLSEAVLQVCPLDGDNNIDCSL